MPLSSHFMKYQKVIYLAVLLTLIAMIMLYSDTDTLTVYKSSVDIIPLRPVQKETTPNTPKTISYSPPYLTIHPMDGSAGRLGNFFFRYASAMGIARANNLTLVLPDTPLVRTMKDRFHISAPLETEVQPDIDWTTASSVTEKSWGIFDSTKYQLPHVNTKLTWVYSQSWKYFYPIDETIRREFEQRPGQTTKNSSIYLSNAKSQTSTQIAIGVHVRRGDFLQEGHQKWGYAVAPKEFFNKATKHFVDKFGKDILFVVASDDRYWCQENIDFNGAYATFSSGVSALEDLTILSMCDHHVVSVGSFGWWSAWLGKGEVIYYKDFPTPGSNHSKNHNPVDYYLPKWIPLN